MIHSDKSETKWYKALRLTPTLLSLSIPLFLLFLAADIKCCRIRLSSEQSFVAWDVFLLLRIIEAWLLRLQQRQQDQHYPTGAVIFFPSIGIRTFFEYFMPEMFCTFAPDSISKTFKLLKPVSNLFHPKLNNLVSILKEKIVICNLGQSRGPFPVYTWLRRQRERKRSVASGWIFIT